MTSLLVAPWLFACGGGLHDETFATGSRTAVTSKRGDAVYAVHVDEGTLTETSLDPSSTRSWALGSEPTRVARAGNLLAITLRGQRQLAWVDPEAAIDGDLAFLDVGAEPVGVVATENGRTVYVAVSMQDEVVEVDVETRTIQRTFPVLDQPQWLALHPSERALFVASPFGQRLQRIDLATGAVEDLPLPTRHRVQPDMSLPDEVLINLVGRVTGDPAITPDGSLLGVPTLYVDLTSSIEGPELAGNGVVSSGSGYGSGGTLTVSRMNPAVLQIPLDGHGRPTDEGETIFAGGFSEEGTTIRSYLAGITPSPEGSLWYATMEASDAVIVLDTQPPRDTKDGDDDIVLESFDIASSEDRPDRITPLEEGGFVVHDLASFQVGGAPRATTFTAQGDAVVHAWLDRSLTRIDTHDHDRDVHDGFVGGREDTYVVEDASLPLSVEYGRRHFFSAVDEDMAGSGAGVSCSTCHQDGRNDGLTWPIAKGGRQTPSLAGLVSATAPVTWADEVVSVAMEAQITSQGRMGGEGLSNSAAKDIEAYVDSTRAVDNPLRGSADPVVLEGAEIFARSDVGCASCHSLGLFTDNLAWPILGTDAFNTPTLIGVSATAPYFHDGSAPTLRDVLEFARSGAMGNTSTLSDDEMDALEAFVASL